MQNPILNSLIFPSENNKNLIILHGFLGMADNWKTLATQYQAAGFFVHVLDLRNHGKSFHSPHFDYQIMAQDVVDYCNHHKIASTNIIGHSMGGKVAMLLATMYPNLIEKCVIADIGPKSYPPHHQDILAGLNAVDFSEKPSRANVEEILYPYIPDFGTRQFLLKSLYWKTPDQLSFRFNLEVFNNNILEIGKELPPDNRFSKPTLFIKGGNSNYIIDNDLDQIHQHFPQAQLETIPNAGHWLHAENPQMFLDKTLQFLTH